MRDDSANILTAPIGTIRRGRTQKKAADGKTTLVYPIDFVKESDTGPLHGWVPVEGSEGSPVLYGSSEYNDLVCETGRAGLAWSEIA